MNAPRRAPSRGPASWPRRGLVLFVRAYRLLLSPWLGNGCRFAPTCSVYAIEALERHGALAGSAWTAWRLLRCHPGCHGGLDPVPDNTPWSAWRRRRAAPSPSPAAGLFTGLLAHDSDGGPAAADEPPFSKTSS